ncbi:unnamed protein product [Rhizoctonia solani]|uniref:Helicase C-terminal domain-containing protein n=1 Tax=Rhizoctonia solani TaxID=456999 RepID=A0A8H3DPM9_9AGAM|nr:unnamed protein product [Rhizoctonia solani]
MASISDMFADIVHRMPELQKVSKHLNGRPLRVATMCSGTESPLLALGMISRAMAAIGHTFKVEHVFSCEIEPFKQAYIERNFSPPILFRDVCELGASTATTAYGALVDVPGNADLLVAGTSCVDFSNLNNARLGIDAGGESSNTFHGMLNWVKRHRPAVVILENVCSAPWPEIVLKLESIDYSAKPARFDTKQYYIPHTRTRGYCVAFDNRAAKANGLSGSQLSADWLARVKGMARPASCPLDTFLLEGDDPRIWRARAKLVQDAGVDRRAAKTDWGRCEGRHQKERFNRELGSKRPMTGWDESGFCQPPDYAWGDWWKTQVERVWDLSDILYLTFAQRGIDPLFKSMVWNLSQNVDRQDIRLRLGISPCLTPSMIPFLTARGGPMTGLEALSLQGLPIEELLLTRETEDQLMDLAGNAMSTTVVGTAICVGLILGFKMLTPGNGEAEMEAAETIDNVEDHIIGEDELEQRPLDLASTSGSGDKPLSLSKLRELAANSVRLCICEGRTGVTNAVIKRCVACGTTACARCAGRPEHEYVDVVFDGAQEKGEQVDAEGQKVVHEPPRSLPRDFERALKKALPMCVQVEGIKKALEALGGDEDVEMADSEEEEEKPKASTKDSDSNRRDIARKALRKIIGVELRFIMLKRQEIWVAVYEAPTARLELHIYPHGPEWRLYGVSASEVASGALERVVLAQPLARSTVPDNAKNLLDIKNWELAVPEARTFEVTIKGDGELVPSWESRLGLQGQFKDKNVWRTLKLESEEFADVGGDYRLLDKCGTAAGSLHVRENDGGAPTYLFFDPSRGGDIALDGFVIARTTRRLEHGETRPVITKLSSRWRPKDVEEETVKCSVGEKWVNVSLQIKPASSNDATVAVPSKAIEFTIEEDSCAKAHALLVCDVPLGPNPDAVWPRNNWVEVDKVHERGTYRAMTWLTERVRDLEHLSEWHTLASVDTDHHKNCERCAPTPPAILWFKRSQKYYAIEDKQQAGPYEQALKNRPSPFVTQLRYDEESERGTFRIGVNVATLMHAASARLPTANRTEPVVEEFADIEGDYRLLDKCGTAAGSLHVRENDEGAPTYLFFDPSRGGDTALDGFVIARTTRRLEHGETRPIITKLSSRWRPKDVEEETVKCSVGEKWVKASLQIKPTSSTGATVAVPSKAIEFTIGEDSCAKAHALLVCDVPLGPDPDAVWPRNQWVEVDKVHERGTYRAMTWLTERVRDLEHLSEWHTLASVDTDHQKNCERCAPTPPAILWFKHNRKYFAIEDKQQAGPYEQALKNRPSPFVTQLRYDEESERGTFRIGVNVATLMHAASARLPTINRTEPVVLSYRFTTNFVPPAKLNLPAFTMKSNRRDPENAQPKKFKIDLRREQLRSLHWMLAQESKDAPARQGGRCEQLRSLHWMLAQESADAPAFVEEEIAEAQLEPLGWRVEGKAERRVHIRGGVLADEVGYGKTAITLGLIACTLEKKSAVSGTLLDGRIRTNATIIVVPPHLVLQWPSEVKKFTAKEFKVVVVKDQKDLNGATIQDIIDADIVITASGTFKSNRHLENITAFAGERDLPSSDGRYFNARLDEALEKLKGQIVRLKKEGAKAVMQNMVEAVNQADEEVDIVLKRRLKGKQYREKADGLRTSSPEPEPSSPVSSVAPPLTSPTASPPPEETSKSRTSGKKMVMEVVIPTKSSAKTIVAPSKEDSQDKKRRTAARNPIVIDSGSEDEVQVTSDNKRKRGAPSKVKSTAKKAKRKAVPDDEDFKGDEAWSESEAGSVAATSESEDADEVAERSEDEIPKKKGKAKAPAKSKAAVKPKRPPMKKRKTEEDEDSDSPDKQKKQIKEKKSRVQQDPWGLNSDDVRRDWKQMRSPPLEAFHFKRLVVDEYTYLDGKAHAVVTRLKADNNWVLSGTPPIHDFAAVKTIAVFLGLHLGIDDDSIGTSALVKKRRKEQTAAESFHSFRDVRSLEWHIRRHQVAQSFLDQFVRQNVAEIDEIPSKEHIEYITLPAAERAIYLELKHHLLAIDMNVKKTKKTDGDREKRLAAALGQSQSAEEALLKRCSHFELEIDVDNAVLECDAIVSERERQLEECKKELAKTLPNMQEQHALVLREQSEQTPFGDWVKVTKETGVGDAEATKIVIQLMEEAGCSEGKGKGKGKVSVATASSEGTSKEKKVKTSGKSVPKPDSIADRAWKLREATHVLRKLVKELVARVRSHRFFLAVRDLQQDRAHEKIVDCPSCGRKNLPWEDIALLSSCGHMGCEECVRDATSMGSEVCVLARKNGPDAGGCSAGARDHNVVKATTLGKDGQHDRNGKHFGKKLEAIMDLIKTKIPEEERVLVFVQFPDLMKKIAAALSDNDIPFLQIQGTANAKSKALDSFQKPESKDRVLLLNVMDESASGANLTIANHAVFLSPLLTPSPHIYEAAETQAIGRIRRYGQTKLVHVWRFLTRDSIDTEIYEDRVVKRRQLRAEGKI